MMVRNLQNLFNFFLLLFLCGCPYKQDKTWHDLPIKDNKISEEKIEEKFSNSNTKLLNLHNQQRELKGRTDLELDDYLVKYAQKHAEWMASKNNLKHSDISVLMGKYHTAGENIAWNQEDEKEVTNAWMNSSGHRANILNRSFTKVGFGKATAKDGSLYWCAVFGD